MKGKAAVSDKHIEPAPGPACGGLFRRFCRALLLAGLVAACAPNAAGQVSTRDLERIPPQPASEGQGARPRLALVVGNARYRHERLRNSVNDARDIAAKLRGLGFEVMSGFNLNRRQMFDLLRQFRARLSETGGVGLFYFAGHGAQFRGKNYLLPLGAGIEFAHHLETDAVPAERILADMDTAGNEMNIFILDACRNNPFPRALSRGVPRGLAGMDPSGQAVGTYIAYATGQGRVANDGSGRNSPFAESFLAALDRPGLEIDMLFRQVRRSVKRVTQGAQVPWSESSLTSGFYFSPPEAPGGPLAGSAPAPSRYGTLTLDIAPADAQVVLPDIGLMYRAGMELAPGEYRVVVRKAGYKEARVTLRIEGGRRTTRAIVLAKSGPSVGEVFRDALKSGGKGPAMVVLPTGRFRMGSKNDERGRDDDEGPVRTVTISRSIAMGRYEVTFAEYDRFARATGRDRPDGEGWWGRGNRPVIYVSQKDAQAYAAWLSNETGKRYRLPSESEWEYAARAGTSTRYSWGNEIGRNRANCDGCGSKWDDKKTAPVGSFAANAFGLYDLHGNVWEWVEDCWHNNYEGAPSDGRAWTSGCDGGARAVVRGGSWYVIPQGVRSAYRNWNWPSYRYFLVGFRLVQDLNP